MGGDYFNLIIAQALFYLRPPDSTPIRKISLRVSETITTKELLQCDCIACLQDLGSRIYGNGNCAATIYSGDKGI